MTCTVSNNELAHFTGSQSMYRHWTKKMAYTEGCEYLCEKGAAWLIDAIATYQHDRRLTGNENLKYFQLWELAINGKGAILTCKEDSDTEPVITQVIEYTDFPLEKIKLYVELGSLDGVKEELICMLPSER
jgi:hypothetical protein